MSNMDACPFPLADGTVYSGRKGQRPFSCAPIEEYTPIVGSEEIDRLRRVADALDGASVLEMNSSAKGGGVAEMLFSYIPLLDYLGLDVEWRIMNGSPEYFEATKALHNLLQGKRGSFTLQMEDTYLQSIERCARDHAGSCGHDIVVIHDPQPFGLGRYLKSDNQAWLWRCHIDIDEDTMRRSPRLWDFMTRWTEYYDASIFSAAHYVVSRWPVPKLIIPPFIDPLSEKNRDLEPEEVRRVLDKHGIDPSVPIVAQIGRFDPWKGLDRTIKAFKLARTEEKCQLILAGGIATDDPEGVRVLHQVMESTRGEKDIHILNLPLEDRIANWHEVNALQRAASIIMQPSTREGFGLVITEALWKCKPVIGADVGAIPLQIRSGTTGFFYGGAANTAKRIVSLLRNPAEGAKVGARGREYVREHFLMPMRVADSLQGMQLARKGLLRHDDCRDCIISFHPWYKLSKRGRG